MDEEYQRLAEHLDHLPDGFPPSKTSAEIPLLKRLFTSEEAKLAVHLTLNREDVHTIASKASLPVEKVKTTLEEMARKGLIFQAQEDDQTKYQAAPFVIGIYEFQVNRLTDGFLKDLGNYWSTQEQRDEPKSISQMRTIPINESIDTRLEVLPYENVEALVDAHTKFGVASCICRSRAKKLGKGCDAPTETCLLFGDFADFYVRTGKGRYITKDEVKDLLHKANEANLVLNPTNSKTVQAICCCCGCCCGILNDLKYSPNPSEACASSFIAQHDESICIACMKCIDRCQMEAITEDSGVVKFNQNRCIGCGLCVSTCPTGSMSLKRKSQADKELPETFFDTWRLNARQREDANVDTHMH
ncbi:MAG: 4Fe-4S binding protein [Candidatus Bathyarchaeia archaeon]|jgi:ferredoxin